MKKCFAVGIILSFLTIALSPIINAQPQPSSFNSLAVHVVYHGHQDYPIGGALAILVDKDKHSFIRLGLTNWLGYKSFYLLSVGHTYALLTLFHHYGHLHSESVNVTIGDGYEEVTFRFT